jgi:Ca2+-transporting ATPase
MYNPAWYKLDEEEVVMALGVNRKQGLSGVEVRRRLEVYGPNVLPEKGRANPVLLWLRQFTNAMVVVLLGAALVSALLGEILDAAAILVIVLLNAFLGFVQEFRAERSLRALKELASPTAVVLRDGRINRVSASQLVPGDLLILEAGDKVAADARLLQASSLEVDESLLTGESHPVTKRVGALEGDPPLSERSNMVFQGTTVTRGRGLAVVVATGKHSEMGRLAGLLREAEAGETPLQRRMASLGRWLVMVCATICVWIFLMGVWQGIDAYPMLMIGVSLAVAAIPEGLPAAVTVCLALGVQRMHRRQAIIRRLPAVETLGSTTVICSDKTGTLTANQMTVRRIFAGGRFYRVTGDGYEVKGEILSEEGRPASPGPELRLLLKAGVLCSNAVLQRDRRGRWQVFGDPTEAALLVAAAKGGILRENVEARSRKMHESPFSAERRLMATVYCEEGRRIVYVKGALEAVLPRCTSAYRQGRVVDLTLSYAEAVKEAEREMAFQGLRVLAFAFRLLPLSVELTPERLERDLVLLGLVGMYDPPRPAARRALELCRHAGIRVLMVTGDHPYTAWTVARELQLVRSQEEVVTGAELDAVSDQELARRLDQWKVLARVTPEHKLRLVRVLKSRGEVVAMTGDGVNDAPALKEAHIGVAMGLAGTEVAKEAASMVLADDNFATIVAAIEEGRAIYNNIRKFVRYLLSCNLGEVLSMAGALLLGLPPPLLPLQILWMNMITDGLPALALAVDPSHPSLMRRPPRPLGEGIFSDRLAHRIVAGGLVIALTSLAVFIMGLWTGQGLAAARTMCFSTLVLSQLLYVYLCRRESGSAVPPNSYLNSAVLFSLAVQVLAVQWLPLSHVFRTVPLAFSQWAVVLLASGTSLVIHSIVLGFPRHAALAAGRQWSWR